MREYKDSNVYVGKEISMYLRESLNQEGLFSSHHVKFDGKLSCNGQDYFFSYQCNPNSITPSLEDVLESLLLYASRYDCYRDPEEFAFEFGYKKLSQALKAYNRCKETYESLQKMFREEELKELYELSSNGWKTDIEKA